MAVEQDDKARLTRSLKLPALSAALLRQCAALATRKVQAVRDSALSDGAGRCQGNEEREAALAFDEKAMGVLLALICATQATHFGRAAPATSTVQSAAAARASCTTVDTWHGALRSARRCLTIVCDSALPVGAGLGSSASFGVAARYEMKVK